ncbi:MAG TPA: hypothetical protein PK133_10155, partial [Ferruginibacter sp.]|nr:hypothetical protein [Ferruginibacter sp.]
RIGFMKTEDECEPVFGVIRDHKGLLWFKLHPVLHARLPAAALKVYKTVFIANFHTCIKGVMGSD